MADWAVLGMICWFLVSFPWGWSRVSVWYSDILCCILFLSLWGCEG